MKETKSLSVGANQESYFISAYQSFGWELMSSQEVKTKDSHLENRGGTIYSVTETEHYIKLTFTRDDRMPNYQLLKGEEVKFENAYKSLMREPTMNIIICIIAFLMYIVPGILYVMSYKKKKKAAIENNEKCQAVMRQAIANGEEIIRSTEAV